MKEMFELLQKAKHSDELWEEQAAAMEFTQKYGEAIVSVITAALMIRRREEIGGYGHEGIPELLMSLKELEKI